MASIPLPFVLALLFTCLPLALGQSVAEFTLKLSWGRRAPDGFERDMILINGDFPGPPLEMNEGDDVVVEVINGLDDEATIHFHGEKPRGFLLRSPTHTLRYRDDRHPLVRRYPGP